MPPVHVHFPSEAFGVASRWKHGGAPNYSMADKKKISEVNAALVAAMPSVWRFGLSLCGRADAADDLVQATALRALERVDQVKDVSNLTPWFLTICRSIWLNELRATKVRQAQSLATTPEVELIGGFSEIEENIFASEVFTEVMSLPEAQRAVVLLVLIEGHGYRAAAEILDVPLGTVMSRLHAARSKLRRFAETPDEKQAMR